MKADIKTLKDTFQIGYDAFLDSRVEGNEIEEYMHNRQYTSDQLNVLDNRGQPKETFNVIKLFSHQLVGYYSTVINTVQVHPRQQSDILVASVLNDTVNYVFEENSFEAMGDNIKLNGFLSGLYCVYLNVVDSGTKDNYGRPVYKIKLEHVPSSELVLDPMSVREDYKDARFIHRFKWLPEDTLRKAFGQYAVDKGEAYWNFLEVDEAEFEFKYNEQFQGKYKQHDAYLVVHSVIVDDNGDSWSIYWTGDHILSKEKITYKEVKFPYRVVKQSMSNKAEYYGIFREVKEAQDSINQALLQIQQMVNSKKAMVAEGAVEDIDEFTRMFNRVNAVIEVQNLGLIKIEDMTGDIIQQYTIIDKAFDRIQRLLGINDSFLGMAFASDSGRKVKLQQNSSIIALRYITKKLELFYKMVGWDVVHLIKQYYTANQVMRITDESVGERWVELNRPVMLPNPMTGQPQVVWEEELDPASGEPMEDDEGNIVMVPLNDSRTDVQFADVDVTISTNSYNDEDEKNQLMLETMLSGNIGNALMTVNPAGFMKVAGLATKSMKTKYSPEIASILEQTAAMLQPQPQMQSQLGMGNPSSQQPMSASLKLPQNTNEGV